MDHSPAEILAALLKDEGLFTAYDAGASWPVFVSSMPDGGGVEHDCGAVYDTAGVQEERLLSGENTQRYGYQVKVRALSYNAGWVKITAVADLFETAHNAVVTIGDDSYKIESISQDAPPIALGLEPGTKRRSLVTLNGLIRLEGE